MCEYNVQQWLIIFDVISEKESVLKQEKLVLL